VDIDAQKEYSHVNIVAPIRKKNHEISELV
jgi:hypothetical protein